MSTLFVYLYNLPFEYTNTLSFLDYAFGLLDNIANIFLFALHRFSF
jgi:hypothetical protein